MLKQVVEVRLQWVVKATLNELLRVLSKPNTSPAISNHTIPLHCKEANFWLDASATTAASWLHFAPLQGIAFISPQP